MWLTEKIAGVLATIKILDRKEIVGIKIRIKTRIRTPSNQHVDLANQAILPTLELPNPALHLRMFMLLRAATL